MFLGLRKISSYSVEIVEMLPLTERIVVALIVIVVITHTGGTALGKIDWDLQYDLPAGRVFGYVMLMQSRVGNKTEYLGGTVLFKSEGKATTMRSGERHVVGNRLAVIDNLKVVTQDPEDLLVPRLPVNNQFLPDTIVVNSAHGVRPTADGDLPRMLGNTLEWFFPPLPFREDGTYHKEGYVARTRNVRIYSYFNYDSKLTKSSGNSSLIKDLRSLQANDGESLDVQGTSVIEFDKSIQLMTRRSMQGVHKVLGKTMHVQINIRLITPKELTALARSAK